MSFFFHVLTCLSRSFVCVYSNTKICETAHNLIKENERVEQNLTKISPKMSISQTPGGGEARVDTPTGHV